MKSAYELLPPTDSHLNLRSEEVSPEMMSSQYFRQLLKAMANIATGERDADNPHRKTMVGLAAPQIGKRLRVVLIDTTADPTVPNFTPKLEFFVNPQIVEASSDEELGREGCYSTGEICGAVYRSKMVRVKAVDQKGDAFEYTSKNPFQARILQHEIDHLDGIRFPARVRTADHLHKVDKDEFQTYREHWSTWQDLYPFEKWLDIYRGK